MLTINLQSAKKIELEKEIIKAENEEYIKFIRKNNITHNWLEEKFIEDLVERENSTENLNNEENKEFENN